MNICITSTPEFSPDKLQEVVDLLSGIPGEMKFIHSKPLTGNQAKKLNTKFENVNCIDNLSFEELFDYISDHRDIREVNEEDYVVLITSIRNNQNWFSAFNEKNIFVHGEEWDMISDVDSKFGIAHQCIENVFQSLIKLDIDNVLEEPNIHMKSIGCINDFCGNKQEILQKLQSANICDSCFERAINNQISGNVLAHIVEILEFIRKQFVISRNFTRNLKPETVTVDSDGKISIGGHEIKMEVMPKTLYIYFLKNLTGLPTNKLCGEVGEFENIYSVLNPKNPDLLSVTKLCCNKINYHGKVERIKPTLETNRSKIKGALKKNLGELLCNKYSINLVKDNKDINLFKINLSQEVVSIDPTFLI